MSEVHLGFNAEKYKSIEHSICIEDLIKGVYDAGIGSMLMQWDKYDWDGLKAHDLKLYILMQRCKELLDLIQTHVKSTYDQRFRVL